MNKIVALVMVLAATTALAVKNQDWYVSDDMQYGRGVVNDANCTNDLQAAVSGCSAGYTVWVKDGFVCDSGTTVYDSMTWRINISSAITVRSESGYVDEAAGKGAKIKGAPHSAETALGANAVSCVRLGSSKSHRFIGFVLEGGCTPNSTSRPGGGFRCSSTAIVSNCVVRNCSAVRGGGGSGGNFFNCVITNNTASNGAGLYNTISATGCTIARNTGPGVGYYDLGASVTSVVSRCEIFGNSNSGSGGGVSCGGNSHNVFFRFCGISNNVVAANGGGVSGSSTSGGMTKPKLFDCTISGNVCTDSGARGGGVQYADLTRCTVESNVVMSGYGGGAYQGNVINCRFVGNVVTNPTSYATGGGVDSCNCYNTLFVGNFVWKGGGGCYTSKNINNEVVNCTFVGNDVVTEGSGAFRFATDGALRVVNCVAWGNTHLSRYYYDTCTACTNSCIEYLDSGVEASGVVSVNPVFDAGFVPKAKECRNVAFAYDWMTDEDDPRSRDLAGNVRVYGNAADMGCYERQQTGLYITFR